VLCRSDAEAGVAVERARLAGEPPPELGLLGGDLCATVGGRGDGGRLHSVDAVRLPIDVVACTLDGEPHWFVAHLVARRAGWRGPFAVVMNADRLAAWTLAPRGHPNDGRVDVTTGALPLRQRLQARSRARSGDHLPHPRLHTKAVAQWQTEFERPVPIWLDGRRAGRARRITVAVEPDATVAVI
jgi:diacylglycerol kinase family enzyme